MAIIFCEEVGLFALEEFANLCVRSFHAHMENGVHLEPCFMTAEKMQAWILRSKVFCAHEDNCLRAFLLLSLSPNGGHIELVAVEPKCKGAGIGTRLVKLAEEYCFAEKANVVTVCTSQKLPENIRWYHHLGYKSYWMGRSGGNYRSIGFRKALNPKYELSNRKYAWHFRISKIFCSLRFNYDGEPLLFGKLFDRVRPVFKRLQKKR